MKYDLEAIKAIPITDVLKLCGYEYRSSNKWLSVKGDNSLKANVQKNTYTDFSGRLGAGTTIDLVMNTQGVDFKEACKILTDYFLGGTALIEPIKQPKPKSEQPSEQPKRFISPEIVAKSLARYDENNLFLYEAAKRLEGFEVGGSEESVKRYIDDMLGKYLVPYFKDLQVGTAKDGSTLFFYTDMQGKTHAVKQVLYNPETGKRTSDIRFPKGYESANGYKQECLFNEVNAKGASVVFVVESEKTALRATIYMGQMLNRLDDTDRENLGRVCFVATGGAKKIITLKDNINAIAKEAIVILLPDCDEAGRSSFLDFYRIFASPTLLYLDLHPDCNDGSDLADFIESKIRSHYMVAYERLTYMLQKLAVPY
jgi:hypothetical protein